MRILVLLAGFLIACGSTARGGVDGPPGNGDGPGSNPGGDGNNGCGGVQNCTSVYAHSDDTLYQIDLSAKTLVTIGPFNAPAAGSGGGSDVMTDLAVAPDGTIWVISETALYTASGTDGHVTAMGSLSACGERGVALTFDSTGVLYEGDFKGAICEIDTSGATPVVKPPVMLQDDLALTGDIVAVGNGTMFGTLYKLSDASDKGTNLSNILGTIDVTTGAVTQIGATGYPKLFGASFAQGNVIGFTHDGTGHVIQISPTTGVGVVFATFNDPTTNMPISFAGAGVDSLVSIIP